MRLMPTHYFSDNQLLPKSPHAEPPLRILSQELIQRMEELSRELQENGYAYVRYEELDGNAGLACTIAFLRFLGVIKIAEKNCQLCVSISGHLAHDVPYVVSLFLKHGFCAFDDWTRRYRTTTDRLSALEFLHHIELQRIESSKEIGIVPEIARVVPVAFAVIKACSKKRGKDVFLLELNKDWNRYNLIGGKQQPMDNSDYQITLYREIEEEIGIPRSRVSLTQLTEEPLKGYSLSGSRGALSYYPCMLYWARIRGPLGIRPKDKWFTEEEILELRKSEEPGLMINHVYLDFLLHEMSGGLKALDYSLDGPVDSGRWYAAAKNAIVQHKVWIIPLLGIVAGLIKIVMVLLK